MPILREIFLRYDLHTHSSISDGILSPHALVSRAKQNGVTHLALTDHDTLDGLAQARDAARACGIEFINGVELSTEWRGVGIHVVGLAFDPAHPAMRRAVALQTRARTARARAIGDRLASLGIAGAFAGASRLADGGSMGRPHFARYLVEQNIVGSVDAAFRKFLGNGKPADVKRTWISLPEVVVSIRASGGVAVLAHPLKYKVTLTRLRNLIADFKQAGGEAIELCSGPQTAAETAKVANLARRFGLLASCGSDFHAPDQAWQDLGKCSPIPAGCTPVWHHWQPDQNLAGQAQSPEPSRGQ